MANHVSSSAHDHPTHVKLDSSDKVIRGVTYTIVTIFCIFCILPFWLIVASSFSSEAAIRLTGFTLWPTDVSTYSYELLFRAPEQMLGAYAVTIGMTVVGTLVGLFVVSMTGYALQRKDFPFPQRDNVLHLLYVAVLGRPGSVLPADGADAGPARYYWAVLLPLMMSPWVIVLMKNFVKAIPHEITESGKIDGAGDFRIFYALILPSMKPALATIGLFLALGYWNEWYYSSLFLTKDMPKPLQYHLYNVINKVASLKNSVAGSNIVLDTDLPSETLKMATAVVATGPIILLYPFVQKYFVAGLTVGSVKG